MTEGLLTLPRRAWALRHVCASEPSRYAMHGIYRTADAYYGTDGTVLGWLREDGGPETPVWTARPTKALPKRDSEARVPCGPVPGHYPPIDEVLPTVAHKHALLGEVSVELLRCAIDGALGWRADADADEIDAATFTLDRCDLVVTRPHPSGRHMGQLRLTVPDVLQEPAGDLPPWSCDLRKLDRMLRVAEEAVPGCSSPTASLRWATVEHGTGAALVLDVGDTLTLLCMPCTVAP